ncbi:hypothetical protein Taro_054200 [Colocasia esculenta]|uniref:Uncharacterized protein n=1 Tax=Colocasia esculenta TaxID=4460 RepID=A0A843XQD5_COLES|nr:hypothetical protein [Colocasia esculenta]
MTSTQLASPEYEARPMESSVGLEADDVTQSTSPEYEAKPTEFSVGLEADGVNTTSVTRI